jgi:diguanylate cyclase (GGDEF)-like protein
MDYGTLFFSNIASMSVFAVCITLLAWYNRQVIGMRWLAGGMITLLLKLMLQSLDGITYPVLSDMVANELYLLSITMQMMGLRWFVIRRPIRNHWPFVLLGAAIVTYTILFLYQYPYSGNLLNLPFVAVCVYSAWMLFRHGHKPFVTVSRVSAVVLFLESVVAAYRAALTNLHYMRPWETFRADSDPRWLYSLAAMFLLLTIMVMCYLWFLVTELQSELTDMALTDPLTGAMNRRALEESARREAARSMRAGHLFSMVMLDIDHFKCVNDTRGHAAGDRALQAVVREIKKMLRIHDLIARTGGEEFTILLPDTAGTEALIVAERVRRSIEALDEPFEGDILKITVSLGVSQFDMTNGGWEGMMRRADQAMYVAKEHGRNLVSAGWS